jgi:hypothetical protein
MEPQHKVYASSFADPADVRAFRRCKAQGHSDSYCFKYGDNGIGAWGDRTDEGSGPSCALPPDIMSFYGLSHNDNIRIARGDKVVIAKIKDRMPPTDYLIRHGLKARIDMNPDTCRALGLEPPVLTLVTWEKYVGY